VTPVLVLLLVVVSFGSNHEKVFQTSVRYDEATLNQARRAVDLMDADMGGTEILRPLQSILSTPPKPGYPRQLFCLVRCTAFNR